MIVQDQSFTIAPPSTPPPQKRRIITGVLKIIKYGKLRKALPKDLNYREPKTMNLPKDFSEINSVTGFCIENAVKKNKAELKLSCFKIKTKG